MTAIADWLGLVSIDETWLTGLVFLVGFASLLVTTRLLRNQALVYFGSAQLVAGTLDLTWYMAGWDNSATTAGWMAVSTAVLALAIWIVAATARRAGVSEFYTEPCLQSTFVLTLAAFALALYARYLGRGAYPLATAALGMNVMVTMLLAHSCARSG